MRPSLEIAFAEREKQLRRAQKSATNDLVKSGYQAEIDDLRAAVTEVKALEDKQTKTK